MLRFTTTNGWNPRESSRWKLFINRPSSFENSPAVEGGQFRVHSKAPPVVSSWRAGYAVYANRMRGLARRAEYKWSAICHHLGANRPSLLFLPPRTCHQVDKLQTEPLPLSLCIYIIYIYYIYLNNIIIVYILEREIYLFIYIY